MRKLPPLQDHGLWDEVRRSVTPLRPGHRSELKEMVSTAVVHNIATPKAAPFRRRSADHSSPPPIAQLDRRLSQRLSRGQLDPESSLDLHGDNLEIARMRLYHFIEQRRRDGQRMILVITGKGSSPFARHTLHGVSHFHSPEREGRLRREVPGWLHDTIFRTHVIGYQPAHPRHGGGGAFYVRLRQFHET